MPPAAITTFTPPPDAWMPPARAMDASTPTAPSVTISAVPPNETNGSGTPVIGSRPVTAPRFTMACRPIHDVMPAASSRPNVSGARTAIRMPA